MMAIAKRSAANPWMPAAFLFIAISVVLFIVVVVLYLQLEKRIETVEKLQLREAEVMNERQWASRGAIIGSKSTRCYFNWRISGLLYLRA